MISVTAPGKAVLSGEYAVLQDAPAVAAAVDRRVRVSITRASGECHFISAPGYLQGSWSFENGEDGEVDWRDAPPSPSAFLLVEEVWKSFDSANWPTLAVTIDTQEFRDADSGLKLGLGSSAAVAVALTAALQKIASLNGDNGRTATLAHDRFQGGRGSGVDVATSLHGGLILYRRSGNEARQLGWPAGLHYRYLWSGQAAATMEKLVRLGDDGMKQLGEHAEDVASAWSLGDANEILESYPAYIDALMQFSVDHDLGIFDAGHKELARLARDDGIVYKPCGAGGGDIGIALAACEHELQEFCNRASRRNFSILDISLEDDGLEFAE